MKNVYFTLIFSLSLVLNIFSQNISSPESVLGYELGTKFSRHHQVTSYFETVAKELPEQMLLETYGHTYEGRPLYLATISSAKNIKQLETIRQQHLQNAGLKEGTSKTPEIAIVWLSYNVHGNEASSSEAAINTLYKLLTEHQEYLENTVIIMDPCVNPDGRDRYANWYNQVAAQPHNADPQALEHHEPWPSGRPNHYLFDLNRDWAWATQIETQSRLKVYNQWMPHIHVDFHEQGIDNPYYFAPGAEPYHNIITDWQRNFQIEIGKNNAKHFDSEGWLYFTGESFDLLYPSYGDTYPTYMGAIGMTYEQAGHGRAGLGIITEEGHELTLKDRIAHHTMSGLSTIEMAVKHAKSLNTEFNTFFKNQNLEYKSFVLKGNEDNISALTTLLDQHEIQYGYAKGSKITGYDYQTRSKKSMQTSSRDLVISTQQAKGKMVSVLFEPHTFLSDSLTYDITAWSLPYAYGLEAIASTTEIAHQVKVSDYTSPTIDSQAIGYISSWHSFKDATFLADLYQNGFKVRSSSKPFATQQSEKDYERGSLIILKRDHKDQADFETKLIALAQKHQRTLEPVSSGFSKSGPDFGSPDISLLKAPKIAVLAGSEVSNLAYGEVWHFFEQQLSYPFTAISTETFDRTNWDTYTVIIIPNGNYKTLLNEAQRSKLRTWIQKGGRLIAMENALVSFADQDGFGLTAKKESEEPQSSVTHTPYDQQDREYIKHYISGSMFLSQLDSTHPLAFGYSKSYVSLKIGTGAYELLERGSNVAYLGKTPTPVAGFAGHEALKKLDNTLVFGTERIGKGSIVYLVDNPIFRGFWENGKLFFANALFNDF